MKIILLGLLTVSLYSCGDQPNWGCGEFLVPGTFTMSNTDKVQVYRHCDSTVLTLEYISMVESSSSFTLRMKLTPTKREQDSVFVLALGDKLTIDSLESERVSHGQFLKGFKSYIRFAGVKDKHKAIFQAVNEH